MTIQQLPWDDIAVPTSDLNRLLAAPNMVSPASWALDRQGHRLFVVELPGDHHQRFERDVVAVHGLKIDLRTSDEPEHQQLVLSLESDQNADLFAVLCRSLLDELLGATSASASLEIALNHLRRWKAFLANRNARILTHEEIRGLFAELWFLLELARTAVGPDNAVASWHGPERIQHDFIFCGQAVEIKSLADPDPRTVRISSENQLESAEPQLYLLVVLLSETIEGEGLSLNQIVQEVMALPLSPEAELQLESKLIQFGYLPLHEYDRMSLRVASTTAFGVREGFPRLIRSELPAGVVRVSYQIQLESMDPFRCEYQSVLGGC